MSKTQSVGAVVVVVVVVVDVVVHVVSALCVQPALFWKSGESDSWQVLMRGHGGRLERVDGRTGRSRHTSRVKWQNSVINQ